MSLCSAASPLMHPGADCCQSSGLSQAGEAPASGDPHAGKLLRVLRNAHAMFVAMCLFDMFANFLSEVVVVQTGS